jgi:hypothetical protein
MKTENVYNRAAATWVARKFGLDADKISDVNFSIEQGGGCETCWYEYLALEFKNNGKWDERELSDVSCGKFIEECVEVLGELNGSVAK